MGVIYLIANQLSVWNRSDELYPKSSSLWLPRSDIDAYMPDTPSQISRASAQGVQGGSVLLHLRLRKLQISSKQSVEVSSALLLLAQIPGGEQAPLPVLRGLQAASWDLPLGSFCIWNDV